MMSSRLLIVALTTLATASALWAGLGDSSERIEDTYGKMVSRKLLDNGSVMILYHNDRYLCAVVFENRQSIQERYSRVDRGELSAKEISRFLKANGSRSLTWTRNQSNQRFERSDGVAEARYARIDGRPSLEVRMKK